MSREELQSMKVDDLRKHASSIGVKKVRSYKKDELIEEILRVSGAGSQADEEDDATIEEIEVDMKNKMAYIESAEIGTMVAFRLPNGKCKSAKIIKKSTMRRKFMVETIYGARFIIDYNDIVWVRHGERWPTGVYKMLKGIS